MLSPNERLLVMRHLLSGLPGLEDRVLDAKMERADPSAREWLMSDQPSAREHLLGLLALDVWNGSGGTFLSQAMEALEREDLERLADAVRMLAEDRILEPGEWLAIPPDSAGLE